MPDEVKIAKIAGEIAVVEARLIAARHLRLTDRVRLLKSKKRRLERRLAELKAEGWSPG